MKQVDVKPVVFGVLLSVLVLFLALGFSYVEIEKQAKELTLESTKMKNEIVSLKREKNDLETKLVSDEPQADTYEGLEKLITFSWIDSSKIERALQISKDTPLDFKEALILLGYAEKYDVQPSLILSLIKKESNFDGDLVGTSRDRGFMQIIPSTEKWLAATFGKELGIEYDPTQIFTPEYNLGLGIRYIAQLLSEHEDPHRALSEYNRGASKLASYYATNKTYQTGYSRMIVSQEKNFVQYNK